MTHDAGEWHPANRGKVAWKKINSDEIVEGVKFTQRGSARVGGLGGAGFTQLVGNTPPYVWRDTTVTIMCNGDTTIEYAGSDLPNHIAYYEGREVAAKTQESDSAPFFRHGPTEYTGSTFHTSTLSLSPE